MTFLHSAGRAIRGAAIMGIAIAAMPESAMAGTRTRLVNCGERTCLRISGHRSDATTAIRIAAQPVTVEGGRAWRATIPLLLARSGANASLDRLSFTTIDRKTGAESVESVALPPGALGRRVELASLNVSAY